MNVYQETESGDVYLKTDVLAVTENLSNDLDDCADRSTTISMLGKELFSAAKLEVYHKAGSQRNPYYLKKDIQNIQGFYKKMVGMDELYQFHKRQYEIL